MNTKLTILLNSFNQSAKAVYLLPSILRLVPKAGIVPRPKYWYQSNPTEDRWSNSYSQVNLLGSTSSQPGKHTNISECFYFMQLNKQSYITKDVHLSLVPTGCCLKAVLSGRLAINPSVVSHMKPDCHFNQSTLTWGQCWFLKLVFPFSHSLKHKRRSALAIAT